MTEHEYHPVQAAMCVCGTYLCDDCGSCPAWDCRCGRDEEEEPSPKDTQPIPNIEEIIRGGGES